MRTETIQTLISMFNVASKDKTRPHLCCVYIKPEGDKVWLMATDGHCAVRVLMNEPGLDREGMIDDVALLKAGRVEVKDASESTIEAMQMIERQYFNAKSQGEGCKEIGLDLDLVERVRRAVKPLIEKKTSGCKVILQDKLSPIRFKFISRLYSAHKIEGIVMPRRI